MRKILVITIWLFAVLFAGGAAYADLATGLVAHYSLDGNAVDMSGNGNHGTEKGTIGYVTGAFGQAASFNGTDSSIDCGNAALLRFSSSFTISAWINASSFGPVHWSNTIVGKDDWIPPTDASYGYVLRTGDSGKLSFTIADSPNRDWVEVVSEAIMEKNVWYHVAGVFNGSQLDIYIDGNNVGSAISGPIVTDYSTVPLLIGECAHPSEGRRFNGLIDEVRIYNRALSQAEIQQLFGGGTSFGGVNFPSGALSFADQVVSYLPGSGASVPYTTAANALGVPDNGHVSLGDVGTLVVRFTDNCLTTSGDNALDIWIFEIGPAPEMIDVFISIDGVNWIPVGTAAGGRSGIDIDAFIGAGVTADTQYTYVKLVDNQADFWTNTGGASGADIDAVGVIGYGCTNTLQNCPKVGMDLSITLQCIEFNGQNLDLNVVLERYINPADPLGYYWKLR